MAHPIPLAIAAVIVTSTTAGLGSSGPFDIAPLASTSMVPPTTGPLGISSMTYSERQDLYLATVLTPAVTGVPAPTPITIVDYPAALWPASRSLIFDPTWDQSVAAGVQALPGPTPGDLFVGMSQGSTVLTQYKRQFNQQYANNVPAAPDITFSLFGNPNRPNGGILERFTGLYLPVMNFSFNGATPTSTAGADAGQITTFDISGEYDLFSDFPTYPLNVLADLNALAGMFYVHFQYDKIDPAVLDDPAKTATWTYGDTKYFLIHTETLPLLQPLLDLGFPQHFVEALDAPLRAVVDLGYDRTINPGVPTPARLGRRQPSTEAKEHTGVSRSSIDIPSRIKKRSDHTDEPHGPRYAKHHKQSRMERQTLTGQS